MQEEKSKLKAFTSAVTAAAQERAAKINAETEQLCLLYTSPSPRDCS